jgi:hypothetical protein
MIVFRFLKGMFGKTSLVLAGARIVTDSEEGVATRNLSNGIYGFTYAPAQDGVPLFQKHAAQSYEIHKLRDGSEHMLVYVSDAEKAKLDSAEDAVEVTLYPEEYKEAVNLIRIAVSRVASHKIATSRIDGNYLKTLVSK